MLNYIAPSSSIVPAFWERLYQKKLDYLKLSTEKQSIKASLALKPGQASYQFHESSFDDSSDIPGCQCDGVLQNVNTIEEFREYDKQSLIDELAFQIWERILDKSAILDPTCLFQFVMLSFADLKSYKFCYWCGFPAFVPAKPFALVPNHENPSVSYTYSSIGGKHGDEIMTAIVQSETFRPLATTTTFFGVISPEVSTGIRIGSFQELWDYRMDSAAFLVIIDPAFSISSNGVSLSWHTRNILALLSNHRNSKSGHAVTSIVNLLLIRHADGAQISHSVDSESLPRYAIIRADLDSSDFPQKKDSDIVSQGDVTAESRKDMPRVVGWELNERGKSGPRVADLSGLFDTRRMMSQAVDLNLRLMKWRLWPEVDTDKLAQTKCLLLGAGTLGCAVARTLLGWGVRNIAFVDNGKVSYSNPARQCLFTYSDAVNRLNKAEAAASALKTIFPDVEATSYVTSIPMPGHALTGPAEELTNSLDSWIEQSDVIFALTDSREARWLPTVICSSKSKLLINVALGFDSYLVMRHGHGPSVTESDEKGGGDSQRLGCYFCTDITAAANSQRDRTLDQQCTVTRPGLSYISAGVAVEMMVALLHSPLGNRHPAPSTTTDEINLSSDEDIKSVIPHQIRGSLSRFQQFHVATPAFEFCTACSKPVVSKYRQDGASFVELVSVNPKIVEDISGVSAMIANISEAYNDDVEDEFFEDDF